MKVRLLSFVQYRILLFNNSEDLHTTMSIKTHLHTERSPNGCGSFALSANATASCAFYTWSCAHVDFTLKDVPTYRLLTVPERSSTVLAEWRDVWAPPTVGTSSNIKCAYAHGRVQCAHEAAAFALGANDPRPVGLLSVRTKVTRLFSTQEIYNKGLNARYIYG